MIEEIWNKLVKEARQTAENEPAVASLIGARVLDFLNMTDCVCSMIDSLINLGASTGVDRIEGYLHFDSQTLSEMIIIPACCDLTAYERRDPASIGILAPFLFYKGFHALLLHRVAHILWSNNQFYSALAVHSITTRQLSVDIHPAAQLGVGIMIDHATGVVIGETAVVNNDVSIMQGVTLGGTGKEGGDRHPKIGRGVLLGANSSVLGNIRIGEGVKVAAGSVVLKDVPPHMTVAGIPAQIAGKPRDPYPGTTMNQLLGLDE